MKIIQWLLSILTSHFQGMLSSSLNIVIEDLLKKSQRALLIAMLAFIFSALLTAGILISSIEVSAQYDKYGYIFFSAILTCGLSLAIVSLLGLSFIFWPQKTDDKDKNVTISPTPQTTTLDEMLGALAHEAALYFKQKNNHKPSP